MPKKKNNNLIFILLSILIITITYFVINFVQLIMKPTETTLVRNGELIKYEEVEGYITRDESIVNTNNYVGVMQVELEDITRVSKGGVIATFVSKSQEDLMKKIESLDAQIQNAMETEQTKYSSDVKALDSNIQIQLYENIKGNTVVSSLNESKVKLNENIKKKAQIAGELSPVGSRLKELITQRTNYETQINNAKMELLAPKAGLVSYRVDGYENVFTKNNISSYTSENLSNLKISTNKIIPRDNSKIKIVDNFDCYITMLLNSEDGNNAKLNDKLYLRFKNTGDKLIPATVEYISEEEKGRLITVKIETNIEELTKYRKINLDIVWWSYTGFKLHKSLISKKDVTNSQGQTVATLDCVKIKRTGYEDIAYVKIVKEFGDYVIVDNYTTQEYLDMGLSENDISNFVTLKLYNEVMVNEK